MGKADIGLIGLAVMGENLVLNMESKGFTVAVYNRTVQELRILLKVGLRAKILSVLTRWRNWLIL